MTDSFEDPAVLARAVKNQRYRESLDRKARFAVAAHRIFFGLATVLGTMAIHDALR